MDTCQAGKIYMVMSITGLGDAAVLFALKKCGWDTLLALGELLTDGQLGPQWRKESVFEDICGDLDDGECNKAPAGGVSVVEKCNKSLAGGAGDVEICNKPCSGEVVDGGECNTLWAAGDDLVESFSCPEASDAVAFEDCNKGLGPRTDTAGTEEAPGGGSLLVSTLRNCLLQGENYALRLKIQELESRGTGMLRTCNNHSYKFHLFALESSKANAEVFGFVADSGRDYHWSEVVN